MSGGGRENMRERRGKRRAPLGTRGGGGESGDAAGRRARRARGSRALEPEPRLQSCSGENLRAEPQTSTEPVGSTSSASPRTVAWKKLRSTLPERRSHSRTQLPPPASSTPGFDGWNLCACTPRAPVVDDDDASRDAAVVVAWSSATTHARGASSYTRTHGPRPPGATTPPSQP